MSFHFAAARSTANSPIARALARKACAIAANDNAAVGEEESGSTFRWGAHDHMLHAALRHFADHGISAAREARKQAEKAFFSGDRQGYDWWVGVCRTLDRRLAEELVRETH